MGRLVRDVTDVWTTSEGAILIDSAGQLWVDCEVDDLPFAYLARDLASFQRAAELHCAASKFANLPRSQQWKYDDADKAFLDWLRVDDPQAIEDDGSYWNKLRAPDF